MIWVSILLLYAKNQHSGKALEQFHRVEADCLPKWDHTEEVANKLKETTKIDVSVPYRMCV